MRLIAAIFAAAILAGPATAAERLVVQLNGPWGPQHAGFAVARAAGLYAAEGLDVAFRHGRSLEPLIRGEVELAVAQMAPALLAREAGADLVNVAQIVRRPTAQIVCTAQTGVRERSQLRGQRFVPPHTGQAPALGLALAALGVVEPVFAEDAGCRLGRSFAPAPEGAIVFPLAEMGLDLLEEGVWALEYSLRNRAFAGRAVRFLRASLEGWARFGRDPERALDALDGALRDRLAAGAAGVAAALGPGPLGRMDEQDYLTTVRLLRLGWAEPHLHAAPEGAWRDDLRAAAVSGGPARARGK